MSSLEGWQVQLCVGGGCQGGQEGLSGLIDRAYGAHDGVEHAIYDFPAVKLAEVVAAGVVYYQS